MNVYGSVIALRNLPRFSEPGVITCNMKYLKSTHSIAGKESADWLACSQTGRPSVSELQNLSAQLTKFPWWATATPAPSIQIPVLVGVSRNRTFSLELS